MFSHCKYLLINLPERDTDLDDIMNIDEAKEYYGTELEHSKKLEITPEQEFWAHCSNLQAWVENDYNPNLLHSNLSIPLLRKLILTDVKIFHALLYHLDDNWKQYKSLERREFILSNFEDLISKAIKYYKIDWKDLESTSIFVKTMILIRLSKIASNKVLLIKFFSRKKKEERAKRRFLYHERKTYGSDLDYRHLLRDIRDRKFGIENSDALDYLPYEYAKGNFINAGVISYIKINDNYIVRTKDGNYLKLSELPKVSKVSIDGYHYDYPSGSQWKAMKVNLGKFKLYFSYYTLIGFEINDEFGYGERYINDKNYGMTTNGHKWSITRSSEDQYIPKTLFNYIVESNLQECFK